MYAVVLAGGQGTRLQPVVSDVPKPMASVKGRPFICHVLDLLASQGVSDVVLSVGYLRETLIRHLGEHYNGLHLRYAIEDAPLGTGGGLRNALALVGEFPAFALNGDTYLKLDLGAMLRAHQERKSDLTIAVRRVTDAGRHGRVITVGGRIVEFHAASQPGPGLINAGVYLFSENLMKDTVHQAPFSFERDFLEPRIKMLRPVAFETDGYFIDIGVPEDYARAQRELPQS